VNSQHLEASVKLNLEAIVQYVMKSEAELLAGCGEQTNAAKVSEIQKAVKADLLQMYNALMGKITKIHGTQVSQLESIQNASNAILTGCGKVLKEAEEANKGIKEMTLKVTKVTDTTDKIVLESKTYQDALLNRLAQSNRAEVDPKVLSDLDRKAKQILIDVYGEEGDALLSKSLTAIVDKANEVIELMNDATKPMETKVVTALKTCSKALLLTLNSKEAVSWINEPSNELTFSDTFSKESHIRQRSFNLILPGLPIIFDPNWAEHLRKVKEVNGLRVNAIKKARWIKPTTRRWPDQSHAYAILSLFSADDANNLIRNRLIVCGAVVRPREQKQEPMQCMKCRHWGHLATACEAEADTCGRCGDKHRTNNCSNKDKTYCINCKDDTHPSWSRECPEFNRRCLIFDKRIPENTMLYFPTEHDWTLLTRPTKVPMADRLPKKYAVSSPFPQVNYDHRGAMQKTKGKANTNKGNHVNPNFTPLRHQRRVDDPPESHFGQTNPGSQLSDFACTDGATLPSPF